MNLLILKKLLSIPTAPFREYFIRDFLKKELQKKRIPYFQDPFGNLIGGMAHEGAYLETLNTPSKTPLFLLIAHMDHPGWVGTQWLSKNLLQATWLGGHPPATQLPQTPIFATSIDHPNLLYTTKIQSFSVSKKPRVFPSLKIPILHPKLSKQDPKSLFGSFWFQKPVWEEGAFLFSKACDDLVGCFIMLELLKKHRSSFQKKGAPPPFLALFTRAEEVGFVGCIKHLELNWLSHAKRPIIVLSLETSRTLSGARLGKGPVLRLGDRLLPFDPMTIFYLKKQIKSLSFQERIMDRGVCEASVTLVHGIPSAGFSLPLGNYHNENFEKFPKSFQNKPVAPEWIHLGDLKALLSFLKTFFSQTIEPVSLVQKEAQKKFQKRAHTLTLDYDIPLFFEKQSQKQ